MIKQYFAQAWAQLRQQPVMSAVSIAGTALAIFLCLLLCDHALSTSAAAGNHNNL